MNRNRTLKATHSADKTPLMLGDVEVPCYVLENGQRVLSGQGIQKALGFKGSSGDWLKKFINGKSLHKYIGAGIDESLDNRVEFERKTSSGAVPATYGYDATILIDICDAILTAKNAGDLKSNQIIYAEHAEIIIRSVAKVGIIALVDEATGYQYDREAQALQKILKAYISEELLAWQKRFPDVFYQEIFRLNGWNYTVSGIKKRPGVIGNWTNNLIYKKLPRGVLAELKKLTPKDTKGHKKHRFHQLLTLDIGHADLQRQLSSVITIMKLSKDWDDFTLKFNQLYGQTSLDLVFEVLKPPDPLSKFNKSLKQALDYNPNEDKK